MLLITLVAAAIFAALSATAVYSYGRFARHSQGPAGHAIPPDGPTTTALDRLVEPLTAARPDQTGILLVDDNREAFELRALTARDAGRSLDLQYYIWKDDDTGRLLVREALRAADRGVRVRVLLDDINARSKDRAILALDSHPRIEVRLFNPARNRDGAWRRAGEMLLRAVSLNRRMHNKAWIVDGRVAIVGGRNVGDEYFDAAQQVNFQDADLLLVGPAVAQASAIFDEFWNSAAVIPIRALHRMRWRRRHRLLPDVREVLEALALGKAESPWLGRMSDESLGLASRVGTPDRLAWSSDVEVVSDPPEKAAPFSGQQMSERWLVHRLARLMAGAQREALLTSPYFVPGAQAAAQLVARSRAGSSVRVLTNSLAATDVALVHAGYSKYRKGLLAGGVRIHELKPVHHKRIGLLGSRRASLHTKAMVVDARRGFVGSFNLDPRSAQLNTEMGVLFTDSTLAARLRALFQRSTAPSASYRVYLHHGALCWEDDERQGGSAWTHEPETTLARRALIAIVRWLPIESQL
jgi:putative cardiolipin synthase